MGQWILLHALTRPEAGGLRELAGLPEIRAEQAGPAWDIRWIDGAPLAEERKAKGHYSDLPEPDREDRSELAARLSWTYPQMACANVPSKLTATQIKGRPQDQEAAEEAGELAETAGREERAIYRPRFMTEEKGLTPAQRGTAIHQAVQYIPLEGDHTPEGIGRLLDQLKDRGFLTALQREAVSAQRLAAFFQSPLGRAMAQAEVCRREFKFSILAQAEEYFPQTEGEHILLQGVIDAWFEDGQGITVLDFKSDRIAPGEESARAGHYRAQLEAYARALSTILDKPVTRKALWFFATDTAVEL